MAEENGFRIQIQHTGSSLFDHNGKQNILTVSTYAPLIIASFTIISMLSLNCAKKKHHYEK